MFLWIYPYWDLSSNVEKIHIYYQKTLYVNNDQIVLKVNSKDNK